MSQTFSIQPAKTDEQIKDIADLAEIIWSQHFTPIIGKEQVDYMVEKFQSFPAIKDQITKDVMNIFRFSVITHWLDMLEYTQKQENFSLASYIFIQLLEDGILLRKHFNI